MATFATSTFSAASYAAFRPSYPPNLYNAVLAFHRGPRRQCLDLGCGPGIVAREMSKHFDRVLGTDPSAGMIKQSRTSIEDEKLYANVEFREGGAESTPSLGEGGVDMVVAGQAAHWFDYARLWPEIKRLVRSDGTVAFWGYKDPVFVDFPEASQIMRHYLYDARPGKLGSYWSMPGRSYVQDKLRIIQPPASDWEDVQRVEYEPDTKGRHSGEGTLFMERRLTVGEMKGYLRTFSNYHEWEKVNPDRVARTAGGDGDVIDEMFEEAAKKTEWFRDEGNVVDIEWGSGLVMARKRS
ncbi:trans-aconitate methyltransferase 1 [Teratosphaeriaceae sp. CCFEE 6253]|nr:trans-aconitate methyltransferase 1 [Teratosphaeriaceae sp. CCFEE 6253]